MFFDDFTIWESKKNCPWEGSFSVSDKVAHALSRDVFDVIVVPLTSTKTVSFSQSCCTVYSLVICGSYLGYICSIATNKLVPLAVVTWKLHRLCVLYPHFLKCSFATGHFPLPHSFSTNNLSLPLPTPYTFNRHMKMLLYR